MTEAALLIIGDEILSGRTQDKNTQYIAAWLNEAAIQLMEVRVVADIETDIVAAINALRARYDYVFTTGGIGPTHDDITSESVAKAFDRPFGINDEAYKRLEASYGADDFTAARQRMSHMPEGVVLIDNPVSVAPGFQVENVFVMAGVPKIMQAMLEGLRPRLKGGRKIWSQSLTVFAPESKVAADIAAIQNCLEGVSLGSYPFFRDGIIGTQIVIRSVEQGVITQAMADLMARCKNNDFRHDAPSDVG